VLRFKRDRQPAGCPKDVRSRPGGAQSLLREPVRIRRAVLASAKPWQTETLILLAQPRISFARPHHPHPNGWEPPKCPMKASMRVKSARSTSRNLRESRSRTRKTALHAGPPEHGRIAKCALTRKPRPASSAMKGEGDSARIVHIASGLVVGPVLASCGKEPKIQGRRKN
jgi:hypothetical protein